MNAWQQLALWPSEVARPTEIRTVRHGARFSTEIIEVFSRLPVLARGVWVHDCYAGTGERLGDLADRCGWTFTGTELEPGFIVDQRIRQGDATDFGTYPTTPFVLVTSPAYPNGCADHFAAADASKRNTYRAWNAENEGADRELHPHNLGRYGYRGRGPHSEARRAYWRLAEQTVRCWGAATAAVVNVSDFEAAGAREPVVEPWGRLLERNGFGDVEVISVATPRLRYGANSEVRVDAEAVIVARRSS